MSMEGPVGLNLAKRERKEDEDVFMEKYSALRERNAELQHALNHASELLEMLKTPEAKVVASQALKLIRESAQAMDDHAASKKIEFPDLEDRFEAWKASKSPERRAA